MEEVKREEYIQVLKEELVFIDKICHEQNLKYFIYYGSLIGAVRHYGMIPWDDDIDIIMPRNDYEKFLKYFKEHDTGNYTIVSNDMDLSVPYLISRVSDQRYHLEFSTSYQHEVGIFIDIYPFDGIGNHKLTADIHGSLLFFLRKFFLLKYQTYFPEDRRFKNFVLMALKRIMNIRKKSLAGNILKKLSKFYKYEKSKYVNCSLWSDEYKNGNFPRSWLENSLRVKFEGIDVNIPAEYDKILTKIYGNYMELPPEEQRVMHHFYKVYKK